MRPTLSSFLAAALFATTSCAVDGSAGDTDPTTSHASIPDPSTSARAVTHLEARRAALGLDADHTFAVVATYADDGGDLHVRVQQQYRGVPVIGGSATLHVGADGSDRDPTDGLVRGIALDTTPRLTGAEARAIVEAALKPTPYVGDPRISLAILPEKARSTTRANVGPRIARENSDDFARPITNYRLVYRVETAERHPRRERVSLVDAHTGELVSSLDSGGHFDYRATNNAHTFFSGDVQIDVDGPAFDGSVFQLEEPSRGQSRCWDEGVDYGILPAVMTDNDGEWGDGKAFIPLLTSRKTACADAYFGREVIWDMLHHVMNWRGVDGNGGGIHIGVHDDNQFNNAFFSGWDHNLYFGDTDKKKDNKPVGSMTSIDIVGHEYGHALVNKTAGLPIGGNGQGCGMNEAIGDIWGALARIYFKKGGFDANAGTIPNTAMSERSNFYMHGFDLGGERSMFSPSIRYWSSTLDDTEEHKAAGPLDRFFFFLAQGSQADVTSDTWSHSLPWGMTGLGNDQAARIWFRTMTVHLQSGDEYPEARDRTITSARDLFGQFGDEEKAVRNAFAGIDVGDPAANAPAPPQLVTEVEPNDTEATAQPIAFPSTTPIPGLRKVDVLGTGTDKDDFKITLPCGKTFGARLESGGDYDLAIFQAGNSTALASSSNGMGKDEVISLSANAGCTGSTTFFVRVLFKAAPVPGFPTAYLLHMDRRD